MRGSLLDVDYAAGAIRLTILCEGKANRVYDYAFKPYFYYAGSEAPKGFESEPCELLVGGKPRKLFKITCGKPGEVPRAAALLREKGECFEFDVPFHRRYLIDKGLEPCGGVDFEFEESRDGRNVLTSIARAEDVAFEPRVLAFDIETYNKRGVSTPDKDPCLMVGWADASGSGVLEQGKRGYKTEKEMLEAFAALLREKHADVVCTYNGSEFDLPFLAERAKRVGANARFGRDSSGVSVRRLGLRNKARLGGGRVHLDVYESVSFLNRIGAFHLERLRLEDVYRDLLGKSKVELDKTKIWELWEAGDKIVGEYCERDALACFEVAGLVFPQEVELARVTGATLDDASRATAGQHVEALLAREAHASGEALPNKPDGFAVSARERNPIEGAFVKVPEPGVYKDMMVFDFRSLYPSIIVAHNVDPTTLNCACCRDAFVSPNGHRFCRKRQGLLPRVLGGLLEKRFALKALERKASGKERESLHARQWAFKIIANSFYGYLAYPRSRYYSRECGESVTAWARHYIQETIVKAEKEGFNVVYGDSVTSDRFIVLMDENGLVRVKNVEAFFEENARNAVGCGEKQVIPLRGWKTISVNPLSKQTEWRTVRELIRHKTLKKVYRVNQKFGETRVTEDHSLMADTHDGLVEVKPTQASGFKLAQAGIPTAAAKVRAVDVFEEIKDYARSACYKGRVKESRVKAGPEFVEYGWTNRKEPVRVKRRIEVESREFESLCRLLAAYAAEGSSSTAETAARYGASIAGKREWLEEIKKDHDALFTAKASVIPSARKIRTLNYTPPKGARKKTIYKDDTHKLQMMNGLSAVFFKMFCGQKSAGKKLPDFIYNVPKKYQLIFLEKLLEGDGSRSVNKKLGYSREYKEKNFKYTTISLELASGLSVLLKQLGITHTIQYRKDKKAYTLATSSAYNKKISTSVREEAYAGWVYDLSVEGNHTFADACGQIALHNTDSIFLSLEGKSEGEALEFQKRVNKELPGNMELELEDFYPRGIFVSKKQGEKGAKKKYALINREGKIKIRGFELVRRDWSPIARETQRSVLEILLKEGDAEKAAALVRARLEELKAGRVPLSELEIVTALRKKTKDYLITSPELSAVLEARKAGVSVPEGSVIGYVITAS
ncbi:MAG: DNA polymerase domain-containing protein, partial [Candidatus Micrarchaeia archaeon]